MKILWRVPHTLEGVKGATEWLLKL